MFDRQGIVKQTMLIFKNNIYDRKELGSAGLIRSPDPDYDAGFDPAHFVETALNEEDEIIAFIEKQPVQYWREDVEKFFPNACKIGNLIILRELLQILRSGFEDTNAWYQMNTYHFCFLYDVLTRHAFNYNHDSREERLNVLPELQGKPVQLELFVKNYFFNTVFLMDQDKYDALTHEEKLEKGFDCPRQFGVIHGLTPTHEEMELTESRDYPYSIYV
ncbi:MAG: hypothetical protein NPINA01_31120 [Nitrospinaceae bacterium]|nr:MAG: hypothetical protein NPINA01_31120 [Nitrospinaceae bacterium]